MPMIPKPIMIASLLGGAVGVPYLASNAQKMGTDAPAAPAATAAAPAATNPFAAIAAPFTATPVVAEPPLATTLPPLASYPTIEQTLRFDITKEWVYQQWARKSTWPTDVGLQGVRVQLVTGTQPSALAGSLTYFFNPHGQVEHISFVGRTGDPTPLASFLTRTYTFQPYAASAGEQLYRVMQGDRVKSELLARPDAVTTGSNPSSNYAIELELSRPNSQRLLPPRPTQFAAQPIPSVAPQATPVAGAPGSPASGTSASAAEESGINGYFKSYFNDARFATPEEQSQVLWRRWPN